MIVEGYDYYGIVISFDEVGIVDVWVWVGVEVIFLDVEEDRKFWFGGSFCWCYDFDEEVVFWSFGVFRIGIGG